MPVKIRLQRKGRKQRPFYHIVVTDQRNKRDGRSLERLGYFNPIASGQDKSLDINMDRLQHWVGQGAQMSDKVSALVKQAGKAA